MTLKGMLMDQDETTSKCPAISQKLRPCSHHVKAHTRANVVSLSSAQILILQNTSNIQICLVSSNKKVSTASLCERCLHLKVSQSRKIDKSHKTSLHTQCAHQKLMLRPQHAAKLQWPLEVPRLGTSRFNV